MLMNCTNDANPDAWFPELPQGNASPTKLKVLATETLRAINLCNSCPAKDTCFNDGMQVSNLAHGIWGGALAGERMALADVEGMDYMVKPEYRQGRGTRDRYQIRNDEEKGRHVDFIEKTGVTQQEKKSAMAFYNKIMPYLEEVNV